MGTILFIVVVGVLGAGVLGFRRWLEDLGHRKDARDAAYWHAVVEPRQKLGDLLSGGRKEREAREQVSNLWKRKAQPHVKQRDSSLRKIHDALAKGKEPKQHHIGGFQEGNEGVKHILRMWRMSMANLEHTLGSSRVDPKSGQTKLGIRRSAHPHVIAAPVKRERKNGGNSAGRANGKKS